MSHFEDKAAADATATTPAAAGDIAATTAAANVADTAANQPSPDAETYPRPAYAWYMVGLLLVVYTFSFIDRQILGLLGPAIKADFGISDTSFGLLTGFAFAVFYTTFGLYCARIADRSSRKWLIAGGLFLWSLMTAMSGFARNFVTLFLMRMGVGVGEATLAPAANSLMADSFPKEKLSTALSVYSMGIPVGSGLAFILGGAVISLAQQLPDITLPLVGTLAGWQKTFIIVGLPGLLLTVLVMFLREPERKGRIAGSKQLSVREVAGFMNNHRRAFMGYIFGLSCNAALGFGTFTMLTLYFVRSHNLAPAEVGLTFGTIALITGPIGLLGAGWLADYWTKKGVKDSHLKVLALAPIGFVVPAILFPLVDSVWASWGLLALSNLFLSSPSGVAYAGLQRVTPNEMRGQVISVYVLSANIFGYAGGPFLIGLFSDLLADVAGKDSMAYGLSILAAIASPLCFGFYAWARKDFIKAVDAEDARLSKLGQQ